LRAGRYGLFFVVGCPSKRAGGTPGPAQCGSCDEKVVLYLFDLLWSDGCDITGKRVLQRRDRLEQIINHVPGIQVGSYVDNRGIDLYRLAKEKGLEGIIAERKTGRHFPSFPVNRPITSDLSGPPVASGFLVRRSFSRIFFLTEIAQSR